MLTPRMDPIFDPAEFAARNGLSTTAMCEEILDRHRDTIRVKKRSVAIANLEKIITATLSISNKKGFRAMSLRDLADETGLSMGALYTYFDSKDTLLLMIVRQVQAATQRAFAIPANVAADPHARLTWVLHAHISFTEVLRPWLFFVYMEARDFQKSALKYVFTSEGLTEALIAGILADGVRRGVFAVEDVSLAAAMIKSILQDWYIKRWKHSRRQVKPAQYVAAILRFVDTSFRRMGEAPAVFGTPD